MNLMQYINVAFAMLAAVLLSACVAAAGATAIMPAIGFAVGGAQAVNLARDQYPDIDFKEPAPEQVVYKGLYKGIWDDVVDTLADMEERIAMASKDSGVIRTEKNSLNESNVVEVVTGKATFVYEFNIRIKETSEGVQVGVDVPFWEKSIYSDKPRDLPDAKNMMRHIFFDKLEERV